MKIKSALAIAFTVITCGVVTAQTATPVVTERQQSQNARINQGVASGELTRNETAKLRAQQRAISRTIPLTAHRALFKAGQQLSLSGRFCVVLLVVNIAACAILIRAKFSALSRRDFAIGFEGFFLGFNRTLLSPKFGGLVGSVDRWQRPD